LKRSASSEQLKNRGWQRKGPRKRHCKLSYVNLRSFRGKKRNEKSLSRKRKSVASARE
jgi:hypothetical protein